jgi:dCTP deaminase
MILNDIKIRQLIENHTQYEMEYPLISPFNEEQLQGASYDITICDEITFINSTIDAVDIKEAQSIDSSYTPYTIPSTGFLLMPHTYVLTTLNETFYIPPNLTAHLRPKTRFIRMGLIMSGQHINPDSLCKLNIGLYNANNFPIKLYPGISIGQIVFEEMIAPPSSEKLYRTKKGAHYSHDIDFIGSKFEDEFKSFVSDQIEKLLDEE